MRLRPWDMRRLKWAQFVEMYNAEQYRFQQSLFGDRELLTSIANIGRKTPLFPREVMPLSLIDGPEPKPIDKDTEIDMSVTSTHWAAITNLIKTLEKMGYSADWEKQSRSDVRKLWSDVLYKTKPQEGIIAFCKERNITCPVTE